MSVYFNYKRFFTIYSIKLRKSLIKFINKQVFLYVSSLSSRQLLTQQFYKSEIADMASIAELYSLQSSLSTGGIQGYFVQKKYIDPAKIKQQRIISQSKDKIIGPKPVNVSKKTTFIDDVQKVSAKLPGPFSYQIVGKEKSKSKNTQIIKYADRKTFIDEISHYQKKKNVPGAGAYGKIQTQVDKTKLKPSLSKAETPTYLQASMRNSLQSPGVGNYNSYRSSLDYRGVKIVADPQKDKKKKSQQKLPPVGTYNPKPAQYRLFSSIAGINKKKTSFQMGGKSQRFKNSKQKTLPFYDVLSEWGMKDKLQKKDIMSRISSNPSTSRSLYY